MTIEESHARDLIAKALACLLAADAASERAGFGSQVLAPLADAIGQVRYSARVAGGEV